MYLREIDICADKRIVDRFAGGFVQRFYRDCRCITELYAYLLRRRIVTKDVAKFVVTFSDLVDSPSEPTRAHVVTWPFPFAEYVTLSPAGKKTLIHERLFEALNYAGDNHQIPRHQIEELFTEANALNLMLKGVSKKSWKSPDGQFRAWVEFCVDLEAVQLECILTTARKREEVARRTLGNAIPEAWCLHYYLTEGNWISPTVFQLSSTDFLRWKKTADFSDVIPG